MVKFKKPSLQDTMEANAKAMRGLCALGGTQMPKELEAPDRNPVTPRAPNKPSEYPLEHEEQKNFVKWFRTQYPKVRIFAVPNAAMRDYKLAAYLVAEGLTVGVPDLIVLDWKLAIEMKRVKGSTISDEQRSWEGYLKSIGWRHMYAYGCQDAIAKVQQP